MSSLTQEQINLIAENVAAQLGAPAQPQIPTDSYSAAPVAVSIGDGIFTCMDIAVDAARKAHLQLMSMTLKKRDEIIDSIRKLMTEHARDLAKRAHEETGLGRYEDKIAKNMLIIEKTPGTEMLKPSAYSGDRGLTLNERAPFGVIGSITPTTNPTSTIIGNSIGMIAAGNAVVFNVHPSAKTVSVYNIQLLNKAITSAGGPPNLIVTIAEPTIESAQKLMTHPGI
ncbi:MAG: aldehyde dehydrogenase family protein, partial [Calditrichia bacterium]|nr:aldehyde dehydrogenase family protein [Calditrichia bacterium]